MIDISDLGYTFNDLGFWHKLLPLFVIGIYIYIVILDFKYREMVYWKILIVSFVNIILAFLPLIILGELKYILYTIISLVVFTVLSVANGYLNSEKIIGQADIDVAISQTILTAIVIKTSNNGITDITMIAINSSYMLEMFLFSIFIGLLVTVLFWFAMVIVYKFKNKVNLTESIKSNKDVPTLIAFLPWIYLNMYMIIGM